MHSHDKKKGPRLPNVIGLGARKCGTVSLHYYLRAHPEVGVQKNKEMRFFLDAGNWHRGVDWYVRQFPSHAKILFESHGGGYTSYPEEKGVPKRIHSLNPDARFLYLVRDPIRRVISRYVHNFATGAEIRQIDEAVLDLDFTEYVTESLYFFQLEQYLQFYDSSRFLIVSTEDLLLKRKETLRSIFRFLGVDENFWCKEFSKARHLSISKRRKTKLGFFIQRAFGDRILQRLPHPYNHYMQKILYTPVSRKMVIPSLNPATREKLEEVFRPDARKLEHFTGRKFERWFT